MMTDPRYHIQYSDRYQDDAKEFEYRHVILPPSIQRNYTPNCLMTEAEWRNELGIQMSRGWQHCITSRREPNILVFKRPYTPLPSSSSTSDQSSTK